MLVLIMKGFEIPEDSQPNAFKYFNEVVAKISNLLPPMIRTLRAQQAKLLGVDAANLGYNAKSNPPYNQNNFVACEIFIADGYLLVLSLESEYSDPPKLATDLGICYIGASLEYEAALDPIIEIVQSKFKTPIAPLYYEDSRFGSIRSEAATEQFNIDGIDPALVELLSRRSYRTLATAIKRSGGLLLADADKQLPQGDRKEVNAIKDKLLDAGLLNAEFVIICSRSNSQVMRLDRAEDLMEFARKGLKCACGKPISAETPQELLTITASGHSLLEKSRWMSILLEQRLKVLGVSPDHILLECRIEGSEIDCIANIGGEIVMFELKDKEFSLGNAYSFGAKIGLVEPKHAVIITTARVGNDVKEHFKRSLGTGRRRTSGRGRSSESASQITYIEGTESFQAEIDKIVSGIYEQSVRSIIIDALSFISASPADLIDRIL